LICIKKGAHDRAHRAARLTHEATRSAECDKMSAQATVSGDSLLTADIVGC
jgi:hypothetical protein